MSEKAFYLEGSLAELIIQGYLRFKIEKGLLKEVPLRDAVNTIKKVIKQCFLDRDSIFLKEFLVDLRNLADEEGYALCDTGVDGNPIVDICKLSKELEDIIDEQF